MTMIELPTIQGIIRRRILANYRADPDLVRSLLPARFRPKLHKDKAIVGICLIRLEEIRPLHSPSFLGISSENAAHRFAVEWTEDDGTEREGVFVPRRDTGSTLNHLAGGRLFPGEHHFARFDVDDDGSGIDLSMTSKDGKMSVSIKATAASEMPTGSVFDSLEDASRFFEGGSVGYSVTHDAARLDGIRLATDGWHVEPLEVISVSSSFYDDMSRFPDGTIAFDHALIMRGLRHEWHAHPPSDSN